MACPICFVAYDDHIVERRCYNICETEGYSVCQLCMTNIFHCPSCRGPIRLNPVMTRINNQDVDNINADNMGIEQPLEIASDKPVVLLIDISGSMNNPSGTQVGAPLRVELAVHMAKVTLEFCRKLKIKCNIYTFSEATMMVPVDEKISAIESNKILNKIRPEGQTYLGLALKTVFDIYGENGRYFVFTDGEPTDLPYDAITKFINCQLHLLAFGKDVSTDLLRMVGNNSLHTISYIENISSLAGYMVPIFIFAATEMKVVKLVESDDNCRKNFVGILEPQVRGSVSQYKMCDLIDMLHKFHPQATTTYSKDLEVDVTGVPAHGRISYSFEKENWNNFGKFYLLCIAHCHKYLIPGNGFDPSLKHYRTKQYNDIFDQIASIPITVPFVAFMAPPAVSTSASSAAAVVVQKSFQYVDSYSYTSSDDGCIGPNEKITMHDGSSKKMCDVMPGDLLEHGKIKWIIRISNLNRGNLIELYNGVTNSHPVRHPNKGWIKAKDYENVVISYTDNIVYDVILDDRTIGSMKVNGMDVAIVGYAVPGMVHPYWGSNTVINDVSLRYPNGGFVDVNAQNFTLTDGLVSSIFSPRPYKTAESGLVFISTI